MNLQQLERAILKLRFSEDPVVIRENLAFIDHVGSWDVVCRLFKEILEDPRHVELVAGRSYRHVNHFDKIVLYDDGDAGHFRLTIHFWRPPYLDGELDDELIHDHRFTFWSKVMCGTLESQNFRRVASGSEFRCFSYCPEERDRENFYDFRGMVNLERTDICQTEHGLAYYLRYDSIHRVCLPTDGAVATMVLRSPRIRQHSNVYNTTYPKRNSSIRNTFFTVAQTRDRFLTILGAMALGRAASSVFDREPAARPSWSLQGA